MADNLEVSEGSSGKDVRTVEESSNLHVPLNSLYADDGNGTYAEIERTGTSLNAAIQAWNAGAIGVSSLPTPVRVDATQDGDLPVTLGAESIKIGSQSAGLAQESTVAGVESAIGDETAASQQADSSVSATLIERVTAWTDALASGQANDEVRTKNHAIDQSGTLRPIEVVNDGSGNYLVNVNIANQAAVDIKAESADLATQTTLASAAQSLSNAEDSDGDAFDVNVVSGSASITEHSEDTAHSTGDPGILPLAVRNDTLASLADTDGDYAALQVDQDGALYTTVKGSLGQISGDTSHNSADSGNPIKTGGKASTSQPTAVDNGDRVNAWFNEHGAQIVRDIEAITPAQNGIEVYGSDDGGTTQRVIKTDTDGRPQSDANLQVGRLDVGSNNRVPVEKDTSSPFVAQVTNTVQQVKGSAGEVTGYHVTNESTSWVYLKIFDTSGSTLGTTSAVMDIGIPPETGAVGQIEDVAFSTAIEIAVTGAAGVTDNTSPASAATVNLMYR